ncbi:MAG: hypothetical protein MH204_01525, partial [Fimbriimonadaceae bacterium]|nr:hypothetical protein [Fimbriimonadaceae bacterium]
MQKLRRIGSATIAVKLAGVLISLSLVVFLLGAFLVHEQNRALSFSRKEVHGVRLHRSIRPLWLWIAYQEPDAQGLRDALAKVEGSSGSGAERVLVPAAAERVRLTGEEMARIVEAEGRLPAKNLEGLKAATFAYIRAVGDASNLILDPDLDSYYAMDLTTVTLPRLRGNLHQAYRHTRQADHGGHGLDFERTIHQESLDLARFSVQSSVRNLRFRNDGVVELNLKALERAGDRFFQAAEQQGDSPATRAAYREAIEAAENLWGSAATVLSQVLADRISGMNFRRQVTLSVSAVLALFAIGLSAALMRGITARTRLLSARLDELETEDVKALHDGIVALSRGDWDRALEIRERRPLDPGDMDELGRMTEAANRLTNQTMRATLALKHTQSALRLAEEEVSLSNQ